MKLKKVFKWIFVTVLLLNGLFYMSNIVVLGNGENIKAMHEDISPAATNLECNLKVVNVFITGLLFFCAAVFIIKKRYTFSLLGVIGTLNFLFMYVYQIVKWGDTHKAMYIGLFTYGVVATINGIGTLLFWQKGLKGQMSQ